MSRIKVITDFLVEHAPEIFTGFAVVGAVTTSVVAVKATPKALDELDKAYLEKGGALTKKEVVKATYKCYIPAAATGVATIACILLANRSHIKKETTLAALAAYFETHHNDYKNKVIELADSEFDRQVEQSIAKDQMEDNPPPSYLARYAEDDGGFLCYEPITDQYFIATRSQLMWAELTLNKIFQHQESVTLNQALKLFPGVVSDKPIGDKMGWYLDDGYYEHIGYNWGFYGHPWIDIDPQVETIDGQEIFVVNFTINPTEEGFWDLEEVASQYISSQE